MEMQGTRALAVTQQQAWQALNDPEVLKACIPGCDRMERSGDDQYAVGMSVKIGPVAAKFAGKVLLADINPPASYTINFEGQGGAAGFGKGQSRVTLVPAGTGCELQYSVNAQVGGKIAQVGQRLIDGVAKSMAEDFFKRFDAQMQQRHTEAYAQQAEAGAAAAASGTAPAAAGAAGSAGASGGAGVPGWVWIAGAAVALAALLWLMR